MNVIECFSIIQCGLCMFWVICAFIKQTSIFQFIPNHVKYSTGFDMIQPHHTHFQLGMMWWCLAKWWLSQLLKAKLELARESQCFDWLSSAWLSESKPTAQLSSAHNWTGSSLAQLWLQPGYQSSTTLFKAYYVNKYIDHHSYNIVF
jgi:hypothetical protein